ncbi:hypothetical protein Mapa_001303 [Marchantia paleacea]|nr:hypothetical protein Mapa_001303 [Marchantia paleacea]
MHCDVGQTLSPTLIFLLLTLPGFVMRSQLRRWRRDIEERAVRFELQCRIQLELGNSRLRSTLVTLVDCVWLHNPPLGRPLSSVQHTKEKK